MDSSNPYASPQSDGRTMALVGGAYWREGDLLVAGRNAQLPARCPKCNAPVADHRQRYKLSWYPPIALLGLLPFLLIVLVTQKKIKVHASVCHEHRRRRMRGMLMGWAAFFISAMMLVLAFSAESLAPLLALLSFLAMLVSLIYITRVSRVIWPTRITREQAWLKGFCPEFLREIPDGVLPPIVAESLE